MGVAGALLAIAFFLADFSGGEFVKEFQSLISGVLALVAAILAWRAIERQIVQQHELEEERRKRKLEAAKAGFPPALIDIFDYATKSQEILINALKSRSNSQSELLDLQPSDAPEMPAYPLAAANNLIAAIEYADEPLVRVIGRLSGTLQIQYARLQDLVNRWSGGRPRRSSIAVRENAYTFMTDSLEIEIFAGRLISFARDGEELNVAAFEVSDFSPLVYFLHLDSDDQTRLLEYIDRKLKLAKDKKY